MTQLTIKEAVRKWWDDYQNGGLNEYGRVNLVGCIGERGGKIIEAWNEDEAKIAKLTAQRDALLGSISQIFAYLGDVKIADYNIANEELSAMCSSALAVFAPIAGGDDEIN